MTVNCSVDLTVDQYSGSWLLGDFYREEMAREDGNRKRKADEGVEGEPSSQSRKAINDNELRLTSYLNARQAFQEAIHIPAEFMCPLSKAIMSDPVNLSTGQTVDRSAFENLFGVLPDDLIGQVTGIENLSSAIMTPNIQLQTQLENWHEDKRKAELRFQLKMLSYSTKYQVASASELRVMVEDFPLYAEAFADLGPPAVLELFRPLLANGLPTSGSMHENILITATLLSEYFLGNGELLVHHQAVVDIILESLRCGSLQARRSAMTLLYDIAVVPSCKDVLVRSGLIKHLTDILKRGSILLKIPAIDALCELCEVSEYCRQVVRDGAIDYISDHLQQSNLRENFLCLLNQLSTDKLGLQQLAASWTVHKWLLFTIRRSNSSEVTESCLVLLSTILPISEAALVTTLKHEMKYHSITEVAETGTTQISKVTARAILESLERTTSHRPVLLNA
ncbi:unnamed protein product [Rhodiola kirilowii]